MLMKLVCKEYYQFMLSHLLFGISGALLWAPSTAVIGHWFLRKRGTASGIAVCGSGLGGIIYPIMLRSLFERIGESAPNVSVIVQIADLPAPGFRDTMCVIAGMNAVLMLPSWFFLRARLPPRTPPPLKALRGPWKEPRYIFLVLGCMLVMMK
jgi:MFS family permease